jgi:endophilin-B
MFNRAKQMAAENISGVKTEYDEDLKQLFVQLTKTKTWSEKFISKAEDVIQPNPALRAENVFNDAFDIKKPEAMTVTESLGMALENGAAELAGDDRYEQHLKLMGLAERHLGGAQRKFAREIQDRYVAPFKLYLHNEVAEALKEKKSLDNKRLDLDVAKNKAKAAKKPAEVETANKELMAAEEDFQRQVDYVKVLFKKAIDAHRVKHADWLMEFQEAQSQLFKESTTIMEELTQQLNALPASKPLWRNELNN